MSNESHSAGRPLAVDNKAQSANDKLPGFLARPKGAPVYHGFELLSDVMVEGFTFGAITDFETHPSNSGDAFVVAPDNSRAGLVWDVSSIPKYECVCPPSEERWGVWAVNFPFEMSGRDNARLNLRAILPQLKASWEQWRDARNQPA